MMMRLAVPRLPPEIRECLVDAWHLREGERIEFGEPVCDLLATHNYRLQRDSGARLLSPPTGWRARISRRFGQQRTSDHDTAKETIEIGGKVYARYGANIRLSVVSADRGVLRRVSAPEGTEVAEGGTLGLVTAGPDDPLEGEPTYDLRVIADARSRVADERGDAEGEG